ncbi:unnamed protein product [Calypogeia fissa]
MATSVHRALRPVYKIRRCSDTGGACSSSSTELSGGEWDCGGATSRSPLREIDVAARGGRIEEFSHHHRAPETERRVLVDTEKARSQAAYDRKAKSLGLLCRNFLNLYGNGNVKSISIDEAAKQLEVERRRIYDIVNVLESVGILVRHSKNKYKWNGFDKLPEALQAMKETALREYGPDGFRGTASASENKEPQGSGSSAGSSGDENQVGAKVKIMGSYIRVDGDRCLRTLDGNSPTSVLSVAAASQSESERTTANEVRQPVRNQRTRMSKEKADCRREKSLGLLSQKFVQLFLVSKTQIVSLEDAAKILLGDSIEEARKLKTKARRLYDIANILSSLQLIEKTHMTENRKPAFRWLGTTEGESSRKRVFATNRLAANYTSACLSKERRGLKRPNTDCYLSDPALTTASNRQKGMQIPAPAVKPVPVYPSAQPELRPVYEVSAPAPMSAGLSQGFKPGPGGGWKGWNGSQASSPEKQQQPMTSLPSTVATTSAMTPAIINYLAAASAQGGAAPVFPLVAPHPLFPWWPFHVFHHLQYQNEAIPTMFREYLDYLITTQQQAQ